MKKKWHHIAYASACKIGALALSHYFPKMIGASLLNGLSSLVIASSVGTMASCLLEHRVSDYTLGYDLRYLMILLKYTLPIGAALATCHLIYGSTLLTTASIVLYQLYTSFEMRDRLA